MSKPIIGSWYLLISFQWLVNICILVNKSLVPYHSSILLIVKDGWVDVCVFLLLTISSSQCPGWPSERRRLKIDRRIMNVTDQKDGMFGGIVVSRFELLPRAIKDVSLGFLQLFDGWPPWSKGGHMASHVLNMAHNYHLHPLCVCCQGCWAKVVS